MAEPPGRPEYEGKIKRTAHQTGLGFSPSPIFSCWTWTAEPQFPHLQCFLVLFRGSEEMLHKWHLACFKQQGLLLLLLGDEQYAFTWRS